MKVSQLLELTQVEESEEPVISNPIPSRGVQASEMPSVSPNKVNTSPINTSLPTPKPINNILLTTNPLPSSTSCTAPQYHYQSSAGSECSWLSREIWRLLRVG